jgi:predicted nucleic acid-binding Zn finger protein
MTTTNNPQSGFLDPLTINQALSVRLDRAQEFVDEGRVHPVANMSDYYVVEGENAWYVVNGECCCEDFKYRQPLHQGWCEHRIAVALYKKQVLAEIIPINPIDAERDREAKLNDLFR